MKKSVRAISVLIAVLMLVCGFPLSAFAVSPMTSAFEYDKTATNGTVSVTKQEIENAGATVNLYGTFDNQTAGDSLNPDKVVKQQTYPLTSPDVGSLVYYDYRGCYSFADVDGNIAIKMAGESELVDSGNPTSFFELKTNYAKCVDFVYQTDIKLAKDPSKYNIKDGVFIEFLGISDKTVMKVDKTGVMSAGKTTTTIGQLSADEYVTVAVRVDVSEGKYYLYVNGVQKYVGTNEEFKTKAVSTVRVYQVNIKTSKAMDNDVYFDNMIMYSKASDLSYIGESRAKTPIFYSTFDHISDDKLGAVTATTTADRGEDGVNGYGSMSIYNYASTAKYVKEDDGNIAILSEKSDGYTDVTDKNGNITRKYEQFLTFSGKTGFNYYISMDLKMGETVKEGVVVNALTRYDGTACGHNLVWVTNEGKLQTSNNSTVVLGNLSSEEYKKLEVYVDISADKYYVWFDGELKTPNGIAFFNSTDKAKLATNYDFKLEAMRLYQLTDANVQKMSDTDKLYFDNINFYAEEPIKGEGFFEYGGYVYYRKSGETLKNGVYTIGESNFKFDEQGRLLKTIRTPIGTFSSNTTNELGVGSDTLKLVDKSKYGGVYPGTIALTPNTALDKDGNSGVTLGDFGDYNNLSLEFNMYTDRIYENTALGLIMFWNNKDSSGNSVNSYHQTWINFGTKSVTGYQPAGGTNNINSYAYSNPRSVDGWTTFNVNMSTSGFNEGNISGANTIKAIKFMQNEYAVGTWLYNEDGTQQIINTDFTLYFSSVNYLTYGDPATSLNDIAGSGWIKFLDGGEYYYAPWTHQKLVGTKGSPVYAEVKIDGEKLVCAFDENGNYTLANGKITVNGKTDYYKDGKSAVALAGYSVSMKGYIDINFYMVISDTVKNAEGSYIEFTRPNGTKLKTLLKDVTEDQSGYYKFTCGVAAAEMTDDISFIVSDGTETVLSDSCSVVDYATALINGTDSAFTAEAKEAARSMLNFGAYAQLYFDRKTDNFANSSLGYDMDPTLNPIKDIVDISGIYNLTDGKPSDGIEYVSSTLSLLSSTTLYHYFTVTGDISDYTFTLGSGDNATVLTPVKDVKNGVTRYRVAIEGISAKDLGTAYTVTVKNGNDESDTLTITYSAIAYADIVLENYGNTDDEKLSQLVSLVKAMYKYYEAAAAYAKSVG